jgi:hypothetical protein
LKQYLIFSFNDPRRKSDIAPIQFFNGTVLVMESKALKILSINELSAIPKALCMTLLKCLLGNSCFSSQPASRCSLK